MAQSEFAVTLVHGTWGRGIIPRRFSPRRPRWFEPGSVFVTSLDTALRQRDAAVVSIDCVNWSGANSIRSRERAARKLAAQLDQLAEASPGVARLIVGHSHGGNICLRAFAHLRHPAGDIQVVTMATPFLELLAEEGSTMLMIRAFGWLVLTFVALLVVQVGFGWEAGTALAWAFLAMFILFPLVHVFEGALHALTLRLTAMTSQQAYRHERRPTLVIRGIDDEAALALGLGSILGRLTFLSASVGLHFFIIVRWIFLGGAMLAIATGLVSSSASDFLFGVLATFIFGWLSSNLATLIGGLSIAILARGLAPAIFGRELLLTYLNVLVKSDSAPDSSGNVHLVTLPPVTSLLPGMRHSLHSHPSVIKCIADWTLPDPKEANIGASCETSG